MCVYRRERGRGFPSGAVIVKVCAVVFVGVPVMAPVVVLRLKPAGSVPVLTA